MLSYRLYQDGDFNFTLQSPDSTTVAIFSVKERGDCYTISYSGLEKQGSPSRRFMQTFWPLGKFATRLQAYHYASQLGRQLAEESQTTFEDKTSFGPRTSLEQAAQVSSVGTPKAYRFPH